jgi:hypothetical protein
MNPFLIIAADLDNFDKKPAEQAKQKQKNKPAFAANDDRYSKTYYGDKAVNE